MNYDYIQYLPNQSIWRIYDSQSPPSKHILTQEIFNAIKLFLCLNIDFNVGSII